VAALVVDAEDVPTAGFHGGVEVSSDESLVAG